MQVVGIIEARMGSVRLPGKVMMPFSGKPGLELMIERVKRASLVNKIVVATTTNKADDVIVNLCRKLKVAFYRGSEEDVLKRVVKAGQKYLADIIVRLTADCPLADWRIVDRLVKIYLSGNYDYVSNVIERSFPIGLDVEVFSLKKLETIEKIAKEKIYREHPPYYFYFNPSKFSLKNIKARGRMNQPDLRLTLDTKEDYCLLEKIFEKLYPEDSDFSAEDAVNLIRRHPDWAAVNREIKHRHLPRPAIF